jgi:hypothetical protein
MTTSRLVRTRAVTTPRTPGPPPDPAFDGTPACAPARVSCDFGAPMNLRVSVRRLPLPRHAGLGSLAWLQGVQQPPGGSATASSRSCRKAARKGRRSIALLQCARASVVGEARSEGRTWPSHPLDPEPTFLKFSRPTSTHPVLHVSQPS